MKKAKIVLSAVALFAVVGGAFAFKARYYNPNPPVLSYVQGAQIKCSANPSYTTTVNALLPTVTYYTTTLAGNACPTTFFTGKITTTVQ
ncbi:hypothetical protein L3C95_00495 [Chitinophaga filiformis]|uniref:hypothetical protein n=1 Tax=Chitinophaga filiformis TaxID=104663 RepID=UPI001F3C7E76|nr:hypothetical protein [Chitinophaga filiformis]MCF6401329.1 hypothetical protein [Chitinophaga filiformis]